MLTCFLTTGYRSSDGRFLIITSTDGFATLVSFEDRDLGVPVRVPSIDVVENAAESTDTHVEQVEIDASSQPQAIGPPTSPASLQASEIPFPIHDDAQVNKPVPNQSASSNTSQHINSDPPPKKRRISPTFLGHL